MKKRLADIYIPSIKGERRNWECPVIVTDSIISAIQMSDNNHWVSSITSVMPPFRYFIWEAESAVEPGVVLGASVMRTTVEAMKRHSPYVSCCPDAAYLLMVSPLILFDGWDLREFEPFLTEIDQDGILLASTHTENPVTTIQIALYYSLTFLNCRNIQLIEQRPSASLSRKHQRKYGVPLTKYYELGIKGFSKRYPASGNKIERFMPHHIVRGHFKTYAPEKPRFGRPGDHGRFWVDSFAKGDKGAGEIKKRWKIIIDEESPGA